MKKRIMRNNHHFFPEDNILLETHYKEKPHTLADNPKIKFVKNLKKILLMAIPFLFALSLIDFFLTFLAIKHYQIATEQNPIAVCLFNQASFFGGFTILESIFMTNLFLLAFAIYFADPNRKVARRFLYFSGFYVFILLVGYMYILPNNLWVLVKFWIN